MPRKSRGDANCWPGFAGAGRARPELGDRVRSIPIEAHIISSRRWQKKF
jgi:hypothetical protein